MAEKILLYFSDTGRGHRSATEAVTAALQQVAEQQFGSRKFDLVEETVAENSNAVNKAFVDLYNYLLRHHQHLMKYYYDFVHLVKPNESEIGYQMAKKYIMGHLVRVKPSVVVSLHPMTNHFVARCLSELGLTGTVKFFVVITDPNKELWRGWACKDADLLIAPNDLVKEKLMEWGMPESKIALSGMPVHPDFLVKPETSREQFLSPLGLDPEVPTLCINSGWAGGGNMLAAYKALEATAKKMQVVFLCGQNPELYQNASDLAKASPLPSAVLPFHDDMPTVMSSVDMMITKAGGLTTFECVAKRLPMLIDVIRDPMPQERGTVDLLVEFGLANRLRQPSDIVRLTENIKYDPQRMERPLPSAFCLDQSDAASRIARLILQSIPQDSRGIYDQAEERFESQSGPRVHIAAEPSV